MLIWSSRISNSNPVFAIDVTNLRDVRTAKQYLS